MYQIFLAENSTDDDWERDFDVELTEEELKAADEIAKKLNLSAADYTNIAGDMVSFRISLFQIASECESTFLKKIICYS